MMTIDTIGGFDKLVAYVAHGILKIETSVNNRSEEFGWRKDRQRTRKQLLKLSDEQLIDIGLTRREADTEARRGFWD